MIIITVANLRTFLVLKDLHSSDSPCPLYPGSPSWCPAATDLLPFPVDTYKFHACSMDQHSVPFWPFSILFDGRANHIGLSIHQLIESPGPSYSLPLSGNGWMVCILNIPFSLSVWWWFHLLHIYIPSLFFFFKKNCVSTYESVCTCMWV